MTAAQLTFLPGAPAPRGITATWVEGVKGCRLRAAAAPAEGTARGTVAIFNGRADFIEKHFEVLAELQQRGYATLAFDWRGQGLSDRLTTNRLKGHAVDFDDHIADVARILSAFPDLPRPLTVLAHSMGGALAVRAVMQGVIAPDRIVLTSPMFGINTGAVPTSVGRLLVSGLMSMGLSEGFFPGRATDPLQETIAKTLLTHDAVRFDRSQNYMRANADLMLGGVTIGWLSAAFQLLDAIWVPGALEAVACPVDIMAAEHDALVDIHATKMAAQHLPHGHIEIVPEARHEILHEQDPVRVRFWAMWDRV